MAGESGAHAMPEIRVLAGLTFAGLVLGLFGGLLLAGTSIADPVLAVAAPVGDIWLRALKMTILPLVAGLLFIGIVQTVETARGGAVARRTMGVILAVLAFSAVVGIVVTPLLLGISPAPSQAMTALLETGGEPGAVPGVIDFAYSLFPTNIVEAAAKDAMLPFVVFIALFALAATKLAPAHRESLTRLFEALAAAMMVLIGWILALAPVGVFALALGLVAKSGIALLGSLLHYIVIVSLTGAVVLLGGYLLGLWANRRRRGFARAMLPAQAVAISTQSSLASLPAMLVSCRRLGLKDATAEFVLPLAVAVFRATSPAMNLAVAIYAAHLTATPLTAAALIAGAGVAILISLGSVSLPGTLSFVASVGPIAIAMGVPVEPLAILVAVEMLPDVMRTLGNVTMDVALVSVVDQSDD
ncbi:MAG: cation:dicarboxylase symporter family transporter [Sphingomonadaceae bacterium]